MPNRLNPASLDGRTLFSDSTCGCPMCRGNRLIRAGTDAQLRALVRDLTVERREDGSQRFVVSTVDGWSTEVTQAEADRIMRARDGARDEARLPDANARVTATSIREAMESIVGAGTFLEEYQEALASTRRASVTVDLAATEERVVAEVTNPEQVLRNRWSYYGTVPEPVGQTFEEGGAEYKVTGGVLIGASRRLRVIAKNLTTGAEKTFDPAHVAEALMPQARSPSRGGTPRRRAPRRPARYVSRWWTVRPDGHLRLMPRTWRVGDACENVRAIIGGYAERHQLRTGGGFVWMNEDAGLMNLPRNPTAEAIYGRGRVLGTVMIETASREVQERLEAMRNA